LTREGLIRAIRPSAIDNVLHDLKKQEAKEAQEAALLMQHPELAQAAKAGGRQPRKR
jgi:hypothetical protein